MELSSAEAPSTVGGIVRELRRERGWTQEELGRKAGYKAGAGVSISRFETGQVEPSRKHFEGIAMALGFTAEALRALAGGAGGGAGRASNPASRRLERVQTELERRTQIVTDLGQAFNDAHNRAKDDFLLRFIDIARRIDGVDPSRFTAGDVEGLDEAAAEAAYGIELTRFGVVQALAATTAGAAESAVAGADLAYPTFTAVVAGAAATAASSASDSTGAMQVGLVSALRVRSSPTARKVAAASTAVIVSGFAVGVIAGLWQQQRNRKELQRELDSTLDRAEAELAENEPNVEALLTLLPEAAELLEYVAVHAAHALGRWESQLGLRTDLDGGDRHRFDDFVEIAAAQLAVASLDFETLAEGRGDVLDSAVERAHQTLARARSMITSRV